MVFKNKRVGLYCGVALTALISATAAFGQTVNFDVPSDSAVNSIPEFARQAGIQIVAPSDQLGGVRTHAVKGSKDLHTALDELLAGTSLEIASESGQTVMLRIRSKNVEAASNDEAANPRAETVIVTGSRIPTQVGNTAQDVRIYDQKTIARSGQSSVGDFLSTLPSASVSLPNLDEESTVTLRGLPVGTTLTLINGRRVEVSGIQGTLAQNDFFDLNNIPLAIVDRIEVVADGSSAVYGSDAIAGVVNIITKKDFTGIQADAQFGGAAGIDDFRSSVAWGAKWDRATFSIVGTYETQGSLATSERALTASNDYTRFGGPNNNYPMCLPGNAFSLTGDPLPGAPAGSRATFAGVANSAGSGGATFGDFNYGSLNTCSLTSGYSLIPQTWRAGVFAQASYDVSSAVSVFAELMYSHVSEKSGLGYQSLFALQGFQSYTVGASNPYNPFGEDVGVGLTFTDVLEQSLYRTDFLRPVVGARGVIAGSWNWEVSVTDSMDWTNNLLPNYVGDSAAIQSALNASTAGALNPFVSNLTSQSGLVKSFFSNGLFHYSGRDLSINGFVQGSPFSLPAGDVQIVLGGEFDRESLANNVLANAPGSILTSGLRTNNHRNSFAIFGEAKIPLLTRTTSGDELALTVAGRFDDYSDFGTVTTPQLGVEWRPLEELLVRGTYSKAFKAPPLPDLYAAQATAEYLVTDPVSGLQIQIPVLTGGNPQLKASQGESKTAGVVYDSADIPGLRLSLMGWSVNESQAIQNVLPQYIIDNQGSFPGRVIKNAAGEITSVIGTYVNFGSIQVSGIDYEASYSTDTPYGTFTPSLSFSQTVKYASQLLPGTAKISGLSRAQDSGTWAPRWRGTVGLSWEMHPLAAHIGARYVGSYYDYDSTRIIGDYWTIDANLHWDIGSSLSDDEMLQGTSIEVGAVNLFDRSPQYSNYSGSFFGFDAAQDDIRGRYVYVRLGTKL